MDTSKGLGVADAMTRNEKTFWIYIDRDNEENGTLERSKKDSYDGLRK